VAIAWDDEIDDVLGGDLVVALGYPTPARGAVLTPMTPLGPRDRAAGTVTLTTPVALSAKQAALRRDPRVAVAYHAREHGGSRSPLFVLVQGRAAVGGVDRAWLESITPEWERKFGPRSTGPVGWLMAPYYWQRVAITIAVERIVVLGGPDRAAVTVLGAPLPAEPPPAQSPPRGGTGPRVDVGEAARHVDRLPHTLLGWVGADGLPVVVPVTGATGDEQGLRLTTPAGDLLPPGGRRAGLLSHRFGARVVGQEQRRGTGWLDVDPAGAVRYAPHTAAGYAVPASKAVFVLGVATALRAGTRRARARGAVGAGDELADPPRS
jgi:hypothetical protein